MKEYTIIYKDNTTKQADVTDQAELIREYFDGDDEKFKNEVSMLRWSEATMQYQLDVATGKISSQMFSADVNPYGWRQGEKG